jgi:hypothetical protein
MSSFRRFMAYQEPAMKTHPHHQTTGVDNASPGQPLSGGSTSIGSPGK